MVSETTAALPRHVAIILDGNGRWATLRGLPRVAGHTKGAERVREVVRAAGQIGIPYLTIFALSLDNRKRPRDEVQALYGLLERFAKTEQNELVCQGARVQVIGDIPSLPRSCQRALQGLCDATADGTSMVFRIAVAYGARQDVAQATQRIAERVACGELAAKDITDKTLRAHMWSHGAPDPDLVIRTGGDHRLSDFLLLEAAYSELYFTETAWPDFDGEQLRLAVRDFSRRERRFGLVASPRKTNGVVHVTSNQETVLPTEEVESIRHRREGGCRRAPPVENTRSTKVKTHHNVGSYRIQARHAQPTQRSAFEWQVLFGSFRSQQKLSAPDVRTNGKTHRIDFIPHFDTAIFKPTRS